MKSRPTPFHLPRCVPVIHAILPMSSHVSGLRLSSPLPSSAILSGEEKHASSRLSRRHCHATRLLLPAASPLAPLPSYGKVCMKSQPSLEFTVAERTATHSHFIDSCLSRADGFEECLAVTGTLLHWHVRSAVLLTCCRRRARNGKWTPPGNCSMGAQWRQGHAILQASPRTVISWISKLNSLCDSALSALKSHCVCHTPPIESVDPLGWQHSHRHAAVSVAPSAGAEEYCLAFFKRIADAPKSFSHLRKATQLTHGRL